MDANDETVDPDRTRTAGGAQEPPSPTGRFLAGYELVRELGRGGMGVVYEARDTNSGQAVALKVLDVVGRGFDLDLALREARSMASVSHPNTVFLYRAERTESDLLLAMELLSGGTLEDLLETKKRLPYREAVEITLQLIEGLEAFDQRGIVHRDIKPSNCFVNADGKVKIGDLGISRSSEAMGKLTQEGRFVGTPLYSSPEQLRGEAVDRRSDIYSLAATLYEMLTGVPPVTAPDGVTLVARLMTEEPAAPSRLVPEIPRGLDRIVLSALAKRPQQRPTSYAELAEALAPYGSQTAGAISLVKRGLGLVLDLILVDLGLGGLTRAVAFSGFEGNLPAWLSSWDGGIAVTLYFGLAALFWDRTPAGALLGMRITRQDRSAASRSRSLLRATIKILPLALMMGPQVFPGSGLVGLGALALFPTTARRRNGYRCLHELLSGTRVIHDPTGGLLPRLLTRRLDIARWRGRSGAASVAGPAPTGEEPRGAARRFGGFEGRRRLAENAGSELWQAQDPLLEREAWVLLHDASHRGASIERRELDRPSRLRWVAGGVQDERHWDAFEAPLHARTLSDLPPRERRMRWRKARPLLGMLARELEASRLDGTMPGTLSLSQIVLRSDGALLLVEIPLDADPDTHAERFPVNDQGLISFLRVLVATLVTGKTHSSEEAMRRRGLARLPVRDHEILRALWKPQSDAWALISRIAAELSGRPPANLQLTVARRSKQVFASAFVGAIFFLIAFLLLVLVTPDWIFPLRETRQGAVLTAATLLLYVVSSALLFRGGLALAVDGVEVLRLDGSRASRMRCGLRAVPLGLALAILGGAAVLQNTLVVNVAVWTLAGAAVFSIASPSRGPGDWLAGTSLLPAREKPGNPTSEANLADRPD